MSVAPTLLGLLAEQPRHGYELKQLYDERFGSGRPLRFGQVYATLSRLLRDGLVGIDAVEPGEGPERKRYALTAAGVDDFERWLGTAEPPQAYLNSTLFAKVILAVVTGRSARGVLKTQRSAHIALMRNLTASKRTADVASIILIDYALAHLEADLRWMELTAARLDELTKEARQ